nr:hypothetical protein [uncultured Undibacterium sp.]
MTIQIREFRFDDKPWRIDWLGKIVYPAGSRGEPRITVFLTELIANYLDPLSNLSIPPNPRHKSVEIRIGQIALLKIGSVWIDGIEARPHKAPESVSCILSHEKIRLSRFDCHISLGNISQPLFAANRYRIGIDALREVSSSWVLLIDNPTPELKLLVIPATSIFQKCLATSPKAVRRLIYGEINKVIDPSCHFIEGEPETYFIELFKDFRDTEGKALANLVADPIAKKELKRLRDSLIVESSNSYHGESKTHLKISLPFSNHVQITANGKYLAFNTEQNGKPVKEWGFLATELTALRTRLVFSRLIIDRKNNAAQGKNAGDVDLPLAWSPNDKTPIEPGEPSQITSEDDPEDNFEKMILEVSGDFEVEELEIVKEEKDVQQYRGKPRGTSEKTEFNGTGTTGDPSSSNTGTAEIDLTPNQTPNIPINLEYFFETLNILEKKAFPFKTIIVSKQFNKRETDGRIVNFLPKQIKGVRSWHLSADYSSAPPRAYIVVEMLLADVWHYLIELQRKEEVAIALLHFRDQSGNRIDRSRIEQFMLDVARENGWSAKQFYRNWIFQTIKHKPRSGTESFANSIIKKIF